jgi:outer membrane biosynthesis protein TonB
VSKFAVKNMSADHGKSDYRNELLLASALVAAGLAIVGLSLTQLRANNPQLAQATQPLQQAPETETKPTAKPAEPATTGTRPTTPAPEPARPDPDAQKSGAQPALPPAPAEKTAPPIKDR